MSGINVSSAEHWDWLEMKMGSANAVGPAFLRELDASLEELEEQVASTTPRPVLLIGEGNAFSAGLDLLTVVAYERDELEAFLNEFHRIFFRLAILDRPVIAVVNGHAVAGGMVLLMACDWRIGAKTLPDSSRTYKFGLRESVLGIPLPPVGAALLELAVPSLSHRLELALTGDFIDPHQALGYGLLNQLVDSSELREVAEREARRWSQSGALAATLLKQDIKARKLAPFREPRYREFLDAWYSPLAQERISQTVESLKQSKRS